MRKNTWFMVMTVLICLPVSGSLANTSRKARTVTTPRINTNLREILKTTVKAILPIKFINFFGSTNTGTLTPGTKGKDFTPPGFVAGDVDECKPGKNTGYENYCFDNPAGDKACQDKFGTDSFCFVSQESQDNGSYEGCCGKKEGDICPNGQPPVGGKCEGEDNEDPPPVNAPPVDEEPGCIGLKLTHLTDNIVKIKYGNFCPYEIDPATLITPLLRLNSINPAKVILPEISDPESPESTEWQDLPNALTGTYCHKDPGQCQYFPEYYDEAVKNQSEVWTAAAQDAGGFQIYNYDFWKIENLSMDKKEGCVLPDGKDAQGNNLNPFSANTNGDALIGEGCWTTLGFGRIKDFYDEDLDDEGHHTGKFTPRSWLVIHVKEHPAGVFHQVKGKLVHGEARLMDDGEFRQENGALPPTLEVGVGPIPVKGGALSDQQPYWSVTATIQGGTFHHQLSFMNDNNLSNWESISCPESGNDTNHPEGYSFGRSFHCPLSKQLFISGTAFGLNQFDHLNAGTTVGLTNPAQLTLDTVNCYGQDPVTGNWLKPGNCDFSEGTTGNENAKESYEKSNSGEAADPNGSTSDITGFVNLQYNVGLRSTETKEEVTSGSAGVTGWTVTPDTTTQVPWVKKLVIQPDGVGCNEGPVTITILDNGKITGTTNPEGAELTAPSILANTLTGNAGLVRNYQCFKYKLTAIDFDDTEISGPSADVELPTAEFKIAHIPSGKKAAGAFESKWDGYDECDNCDAYGASGECWDYDEQFCGYNNYRVENTLVDWVGKYVDIASLKVTCSYDFHFGAPKPAPIKDQPQLFEMTNYNDSSTLPSEDSNQLGYIRQVFGTGISIEPWDDMTIECKATVKALPNRAFFDKTTGTVSGTATDTFTIGLKELTGLIPANPNGIDWEFSDGWDAYDGCYEECGPYCAGDNPAVACD